MHIKKQRLLTPGPTPLYPKALHAMMAPICIIAREDFRNVYSSVLADLKEVMGTSHDVLVLVASGTGAMDASVSNCFSPGDRVIVCSAGKFGERWAEIAKAYGLNAVVLEAPYGKAVSPETVEEALAANPDTKGVFVQASETSTGAAHDVRAMGEAVKKTGAIFVVDAITGLGTMPLDIDGWGLDIVHRRIAEGVHDPAGPGVHVDQPESLGLHGDGQAAALLFQSEERKEERGGRRIALDAGHCADSGAGGSAEVHQTARHGQAGG